MKTILYYFYFLASALYLVPVAAGGEPSTNSSIAIIMEIENNDVSYKIGSTKLNPSNIYSELAQIYGDHARDTVVVILMNDKVPMSSLRRLNAIVGKIGAKSIRHFYFDDSKQRIGEIRFGPTKPFTIDSKRILKDLE